MAVGGHDSSGGSGDGSGGGSPPSQNNAPPTVSLSADPSTVASGQASSISWTTSHADSCTASGGWTGSRPTNGSASTGPLTSTTTFTLSCTGIGGSANGSATVSVDTPTASSVFPLHVEAGKRYLLTAQGQPFFVHGDAAWSIMVQLTRDQVDQYLEDRRQKGFNTILVELIEHHFADNAPNNVYGDGPFTTPGDFSTPNEAYFSNAEYVISKAGERGFLVLLAPAFMGFEGGAEGWYQEMVENGATKLRGYGQYVANRFRAYGNVLWIEGGDYNPPETALVNAVANGIRDVDTPWLQTFEGRRGTAALQFFDTPPSWLTVNDIYTDESTVVSAAFQEYSRSAMPFFLIEARYEGEGATAQVVRAQAYQATLSGAVGHVMGNHPVWSFSSGWQSALSSPGAVTLTHFRGPRRVHRMVVAATGHRRDLADRRRGLGFDSRGSCCRVRWIIRADLHTGSARFER